MSNLRGYEAKVNHPPVTNAEATDILNQMEDLVNDYRILAIDFDIRQQAVAEEFLRANPSFHNAGMQEFVDRANTLLDRVDGRHGRGANDRNMIDQRELRMLSRLHQGGRRDLAALQIRLQARFGRQNNPFSGPTQLSQMRPPTAFQANPRYPSRIPIPYPRRGRLQPTSEVQQFSSNSPPQPSQPSFHQQTHHPSPQPPLRPQPSRPMGPIPSLSPQNQAQAEISRLGGDNRVLRDENAGLREQLRLAREEVEEIQERFDAWYDTREAELERAENKSKRDG